MAQDGVVHEVRTHSSKGAHVAGLNKYKKLHDDSVRDPTGFWGRLAKTELQWMREFDAVRIGNLTNGDLAWFVGGKLNVSEQCLDRWVEAGRGDDVAIIWEKDEPGQAVEYTYLEVLHKVCQIANVLKKFGIKKGDPVTLYMPMIPETAFTMLACARIGAPHSVVFAGFSADALRARIDDLRCKWVVTADEGLRGGRIIPLKKTVDAAIDGCKFVEKTFVFKRTGNEVAMDEDRDIWIEPELEGQRPYCPPEVMDAEDALFYLYTSGSTGKPKGLMHSTAGYILYAMQTCKIIFDLRPGDVYSCVADVGWITGHTYIVYGPLANGTTTLMFESTPLYPDAGRYWDMCETHHVTQFYTAPTAIRALMRHGTEFVDKYDLSCLRVLGTVGEPINPAAWTWYFKNVGKERCAIIDTYWQTETGGIIVTPLPGATPLKPGSATLPFFGIDLEVLDPQSGKVIPFVEGEESSGVLCVKSPWPSMTRTVFNNHERYMNTYLKPYPGYYFTGDGVTRDKEGFFFVTGRVDDVLNVSGHRIGSAEIESALVAYDAVAEAACVGFPHEVKGEGIACYVILKIGFEEDEDLLKALKNQIRAVIGPFASPDYIIVSPALPKTRSGKLMRRVLRKLISLEHDQLGDVSTLADPSVVDYLIEKVTAMRK